MNLNSQKIKRLLRLAEISQEFEYVDLQTVNAFCELREELGLSKLLLQIEQYVRTTQNQPSTQTPNPQHTNQNTPTM